MSNQLLASKITIEEEQPALRAIPSLNTMMMGFVGLAQIQDRGQVDDCFQIDCRRAGKPGCVAAVIRPFAIRISRHRASPRYAVPSRLRKNTSAALASRL